MPLTASAKTKEALLRHLWQYGDAPRVQLAKVLGITKASVTQLTSELVAYGVLAEKGEQVDATGKQPRGRRKILLGINENYKLAAGLVLTPHGLWAGLCNLKGGILSKLFLPLKEETHYGVLELMSEALLRLQKENCIPSQRLLGVGITIYGDCPFIEGGTQLEQGRRLSRELTHGVGLKLTYSTAAAGALLAQRLFSDFAQSPDSMLMIMLTQDKNPETAIFANNGLFTGKHGVAGGSRLIQSAPTTVEEAVALATHIAPSVLIVDPSQVTVYISIPSAKDAEEAFVSELTRLLSREAPVTLSSLTSETLFLAPAAAAVDKFLFG